MQILAADIGGTNARFALVEGARIVFDRTYHTPRFPGFAAALDAFLDDARGFARPSRAGIAFAGRVGPDGGELTNLAGWRIERRVLEARGLDARLLNDFEALAHGVAHARREDWIELQAGDPAGDLQARGNIALAGAGTGLGVALLAWDGERHRAYASEGGHIGFAPRDEAQLALWRTLHARRGRVSAERVVSGHGLVSIYEHLRKASPSEVPPLGDAAEIAASAEREPAGVAARALDLFVSCYGALAGDIALAFLARGGVYICGGIAAKLAPRLRQPDFLEAFNDKGRHRPLTAAMPVRLVTSTQLGLLGAACAVSSG